MLPACSCSVCWRLKVQENFSLHAVMQLWSYMIKAPLSHRMLLTCIHSFLLLSLASICIACGQLFKLIIFNDGFTSNTRIRFLLRWSYKHSLKRSVKVTFDLLAAPAIYRRLWFHSPSRWGQKHQVFNASFAKITTNYLLFLNTKTQKLHTWKIQDIIHNYFL